MLCAQEPTRMRAALLCLCLLGTALPTPVPPPARARGNCAGHHQILLKGCNSKHGFYVFKYTYSIVARRNQTQIKKEEGDHQSATPGRWLGKVDGEAPGRDIGSSYVPENGDGSEPLNHITPATKGEGRALRPGIGDIGGMHPTSASSEGSGDEGSLLMEDLIDGEDSIPESVHTGGPHGDGNGGDGADSVLWGVQVDGAVTAGRERTPTAGGTRGEGSSHATVPGRGRAGIAQGAGTGGSAVTSVTKKEDVHVDAEGIDEFAYIPDADTVTIARSWGGETQISPEDKVKIFIGRANIQVSENNGSPGTTGATSEASVISTVGTNMHQGQPEEPATMGAPHHGDSATSSAGGLHSAESGGEGAATIHGGQELVAPSPQESTGGDVAVTTVDSGHGVNTVKGRSGQRPMGRHGPLAAVTTRDASSTASPGLTTGDCSTAADTPAGHVSEIAIAGQGSSGEVGTAAPEGHRARAQPEASRSGKAARPETAPASSVVTGMETPEEHRARAQLEASRSGKAARPETAPASSMVTGMETPEEHRARAQLEASRLGKAARPEAAPSSHVVVGMAAPEGHRARAQLEASRLGKVARLEVAPAPSVVVVGRPASGRVRVGDRGDATGTASGVPGAPRVWGSPHPQAQHPRGSKGAGAAGFVHLHRGQRLGGLTALEHSRQVDQVRHADQLHLRERALYSLGGAGGPSQPHGAEGDFWSADSSQSFEGRWGSRSDSGEEDG